MGTQADTGMSYDINLSEIDGVPIDVLIDRGYRFNISPTDNGFIQPVDDSDDFEEEGFIHV